MKLRVACLALALTGATSGAFGQDAPVTPETLAAQDPAKIALATKILEETHAQDTMSQLLDVIVPQMVALVKQQAPGTSDETMKLFSTLVLQAMRDRMPKLMLLDAEIYAEHFTVEELKNIDAFYQTEAGQKVIAETPKILRESTPIGAAWGRSAAQEAVTEVLNKLRSQGAKL